MGKLPFLLNQVIIPLYTKHRVHHAYSLYFPEQRGKQNNEKEKKIPITYVKMWLIVTLDEKMTVLTFSVMEFLCSFEYNPPPQSDEAGLWVGT